jgi:hypothetical protein
VQQHLATCKDCREDLRTLRWTCGLLQQMPPVPLPRSFVVREADLETRLGEAKGGWFNQLLASGRLSAGVRAATALVAVLLVIVVAGDLFLGTGQRIKVPDREVASLSSGMPTTTAAPAQVADSRVMKPNEDTERATPGETLQMQSISTVTLQPNAPESAIAATPVSSALTADQPELIAPPPQQDPSADSVAALPTPEPSAAKLEDAADWEHQQNRARLSGLPNLWRPIEIGLAVLLVVSVVALVWTHRQS